MNDPYRPTHLPPPYDPAFDTHTHAWPRVTERQIGEAMQEQQEMALDALRRCAAAGSDPRDLDVLASLLGLCSEWQQRRFQRPR